MSNQDEAEVRELTQRLIDLGINAPPSVVLAAAARHKEISPAALPLVIERAARHGFEVDPSEAVALAMKSPDLRNHIVQPQQAPPQQQPLTSTSVMLGSFGLGPKPPPVMLGYPEVQHDPGLVNQFLADNQDQTGLRFE